MKDPREMTTGELKNWLVDRLRFRGKASADLDLRRDESPYERPLQLWKTAGGNFHHAFLRAVLALVDEAPTELWEAESFNQLMHLIEAGKIGETVGSLESIARSRRLLANKQGAQLHMLALRTLLALGWTGSMEFWQAQRAIVGTQWPGLIFKGLARHNLETAFAELPALAVHPNAMRQILDIFPGLLRDQNLTLANIQELCRNVISGLPSDCANLLREWFALRGVTLAPSVIRAHYSLITALAYELGGPVIARTYEAALVGPAEAELVYA